MTYQDFNIEISYTGVTYAKVLNPLLSCTKTYKRSVAFFSSSAFDFISEGVQDMAKNGGKIYLATSPRMTGDDVNAICNGYRDKDDAFSVIMPELNKTLDEMEDENIKLLYYLVKNDVLNVKIIIPNNGLYDKYAIYHDKLAVLEDFEGNVIVASGSANETGAAYGSNYEKMRIYKSWTDIENRVEDEAREFLNIWNNANSELTVYDFTSALENNLLERTNNIDKNKSCCPIKMRDYQIDAKNKWINNGNKGFFVMATGTGKTYTALYSIQDFIKSNMIFTVIAVPYKHLVRQWVEDIRYFMPDVTVYEIHGEVKNGETKIFSSYKLAEKKYKPIIVVTTIKSFLLPKYNNLYNMVKFEKLLIVDEAHNFYNQLNDYLYVNYPYKLGLSATPVMGNDAAKTKELLEWFGGQVIDLPIEDAIRDGYLVNYEYHPILIDATEEDEELFNKGTVLMAQAMRDGRIIDEEKFLKGRRIRLRAISLAENKIEALPEIFSKIIEKDHTIIYCSDGRLSDESGSVQGSDDQIRHLEYVLDLINNSCLLETGNGKASKFTATEDIDERMALIDSFNKGYIEYLVAIRCLDEGINIPSIKAALILSSNDNYREFVQRRGRILRLFEDKEIDYKKETAQIYDVIVLPSVDNSKFAEIELRRYNEYARLAINSDLLLPALNELMASYQLTLDDIKFKNDYIYGGELDD